MAEERSAEATGNRPALDFQAGLGPFNIRIQIDNHLLAAAFLGAGFVALRDFYNANQGAVTTAVRTALAGLADNVLSIRPSSILVEFVCYTEERYQAFMNAFATGTVKQRLQEEFSKIGFNDQLQVTIVCDDNAPQISSVDAVRGKKFTMSENPGSLILDSAALEAKAVQEILKWLKQLQVTEEKSFILVPKLEKFWKERRAECDKLEFKKVENYFTATLWKIGAKHVIQ